jgi:hypothetical protein
MSALGRVGLVLAASALLVAGALYGLGDRSVLVPPPETVAEEFLRALALHRWEPARERLTEALASRMDADSLRGFLAGLEARVGTIDDVRGVPCFTSGDTAEAMAAILSGSGERAELRLTLALEHRLWRIARLDPDNASRRDWPE